MNLLNDALYEELLADYARHYGQSGHMKDDISARFGSQTDQVWDEFWARMASVAEQEAFVATEAVVARIEDLDTVVEAFEATPEITRFEEFTHWIQRVTDPDQAGFEPRLVPLVARDNALNAAGNAGVRGIRYSCEPCRTWQKRELLAHGWAEAAFSAVDPG